MFSDFATSRTFFRNSGVEYSLSPRALRWAFSAVRRNVMVATPGISTGYWNARNTPLAARSSGDISKQVLAPEQDFAVGDFIARLAGDHMRQRRFAGAVRPHDRVHLARIYGERQSVENFAILDANLQIFHFKQ